MTRNLMRKLMVVALMLLAFVAVKPVEVKAMPRPCGKYAWTTCDMCLRSDYNLSASVIQVVPKGSELVVQATDDTQWDGFYWASVSYGSLRGYMAYATENNEMTFLEFQDWNLVEGSGGWVRVVKEVGLYDVPNPELRESLYKIQPGEEIYILSEMQPTKYGNNICHILWPGLIGGGYIQANNDVCEYYEYLGVPDDYVPATAPTTEGEDIDKLGIVNRPMCLRTLPTTNSEVLRVADTYEELWVEALETNASGEKWYRVINGTNEAYIAAFGVNVGGKTLDRDAETNTALNLRSGPSTAAQVWVTLPEGLPVWAMREFSGVGTSEKWVRVAVDYEGHKYYGFVVGWGLTQ